MSRRCFRFWFLGLFLFLVVLLLTSNQTGWANGVEWSPELFRHRSFKYYQVGGIQVWPAQTREWQSALEDYLHSEGLVAEPENAITWEFVKGWAPGVRGWFGGAKYCCKGLGCWSGDEAKGWVEWSRRFPDSAKALWPEIVKRARQRQFFEVYIALWTHKDEMRAARTAAEIADVLRKADAMAKQ